MKKLSLLIIGLIMIGFTASMAADVNVTFQVNMNVQNLKGNFDPMTQVVRLAGNMQGWNPSAAPDMDDSDGDGIYTVTYTMAGNATYAYKYVIGTGWGNNEADPNRSVDIGANDTTIAVVYYNGEAALTFPAGTDSTVSLQLAVNMTRQMQLGNFDPSTDSVRCAGSMQGWDPATAPNMSDPDGNGTYVVTYQVKPSATYAFKFIIGAAWGKNEADPNREFTVGVNDTAMVPVYYDRDPYVPPVTGDSVMVTLQVDMSVKILETLFDPSTDNVYVAGDFQGWNSTSSQMTDADGDSIYSYTTKMVANATHSYKFIMGTTWEDDPNRSADIGATDTTLAPVFFNNDDVVSVLKDGNINFKVRMDVMTEVGIFDPIKDSLQVRGGFNGWNDSDPARSKMQQNATDPLEWFLQVPFSKVEVGAKQSFKYYVNKADAATTWTDGWERPGSTGGGNRGVDFAGTTDQNASDATVYYDDVQPDWVIPQGTEVNVEFSVDMRPATDPALQATPFDVAKDTLYWIAEQPAFVNTQGWEDTDEMRVLKLTDDDGDSVYTGSLAVTVPSFNMFEYRYAWRNDQGDWTWEPAGFGAYAYRIRYIGQDKARNFPVLPWMMPTDVWTNQEDKSDAQEKDPYESLKTVAIGNEPVVKPVTYSLSQNYPNPFNPSTTLRYAIPQAGKVTLEIYNVLGQKIRTLLNSDVTAGTHLTVWNGLDDAGQQVSTGVYFYKLTAKNFTDTKKMILMK